MTTEPRASLVEVDLLPCPFCGGEAKLVSDTSSTVQCQNDQCIIGDPAPFNDYSHRSDAIAAWNTRHRLEALRTQGDGEWVLVPREPTEAMWGGLARQIVFWLDMEPKTPRALFKHLKASGFDVPQWLRDEPEMQALDHVPSKGTRAVLIYRAMIAAPTQASSREEG